MRRLLLSAVLSLWLGSSPAVAAGMFHILVESDVDAAAGSEILLITYNSFADVMSNTIAGTAFSQLDVAADFSVGGVTYDGNQFHVLLEPNVGVPGPMELLSYNSLADLLSNTLASSAPSLLISGEYSAGGLTHDGSQYHVLLEADGAVPAGQTLFLTSFNSISGLLGLTAPDGGEFLGTVISEEYSSGGLDYDGSQFHWLLESDADAPGGSEVFLSSFNSLSDFLAITIPASSGFTPLDLDPGFSIGGLFSIPAASAPVPEPATAMLFGVGVLTLITGRSIKQRSSSATGPPRA